MTSIDIRGLSKTYGARRALDDVTFTVAPGRVTGFLGPNGAGKSTTLRLVLGLGRPTAGSVTVAGRPYAALGEPLRHVGALLDASAAHGSRTAEAHLRALAVSNRIGRARVAEVLAAAGLTEVARRRVRTFSLGMRQRLGVAAALLGDPSVVLLDEPGNGLDAAGMVWIRGLLRGLAGEGRAVLVSSHLMNEIGAVADHLVVLGRGRLLADTPTDAFLARHTPPGALVRTSDPAALHTALARDGLAAVPDGEGRWRVAGAGAQRIGALAARSGVPVLELTNTGADLESAYLALTAADTEFGSGPASGGTRPTDKPEERP